MDPVNRMQVEREAQRARSNREELVERISRAVREDGSVEPLEGLRLDRVSAPTEVGHGVSFPAVCIVAQGSKVTWLGNRSYPYDPDRYLIATSALPYSTQITEASKERPYLGVVHRIDPALASSVIVEAGQPDPRRQPPVSAMDVSPLHVNLLEAVLRLVRLVDAPVDEHVLVPMIKWEIVYRLLIGEQGNRIRHIATLGGQSNRIAEAIDRLRREFDRPIRIENLAYELGMSVSSFHFHFKEVTGMSPLQFQKQLRLQEARRLMLGEDLDAAGAGYRVGYDDPSYFSREYKRLFGAPPMRDVGRLRGVAPDGVRAL
jgi:AraC-like DNA-binding protein